jgi:geranylgeranyl diphosphate synthase type 3
MMCGFRWERCPKLNTQRLRSARQSHLGLFPNQGRLHEPPVCRGGFGSRQSFHADIQYEDNKGFAEDLSEGKFSFPVVHGIRADPTNRQILNVLQKRTNSHSLKTYIVNHLRHTTHSFAYTRKVLLEIKAQLVNEVESLGGNVGLEAILKRLDVPKEDVEVGANGTPALVEKNGNVAGKGETRKNGPVTAGTTLANGVH